MRELVLSVADRESGEQVSALVGKALTAWDAVGLVDAVELCARELWGNVVRHTSAATSGPDRRTGRVVLWCSPGERLRLEVSDRGDRMPVLGRPLPDPALIDWERMPDHIALALVESGRGLGMVQRTADAMSWQPLPDGGKTVWCEFAMASPPVTVPDLNGTSPRGLIPVPPTEQRRT